MEQQRRTGEVSVRVRGGRHWQDGPTHHRDPTSPVSCEWNLIVTHPSDLHSWSHCGLLTPPPPTV